MPSLDNKTVLIIGRGSGIAGAIACAVREAGGQVIAAGRDTEALAEAYRGTDVGIERVDVTDESSVAELAGRVPSVNHVVSTASARARGGYADLAPDLVAASLAVKAIGPLLLAKHFAKKVPPDGSFLFMSGATALKPTPPTKTDEHVELRGAEEIVAVAAPGTAARRARGALRRRLQETRAAGPDVPVRLIGAAVQRRFPIAANRLFRTGSCFTPRRSQSLSEWVGRRVVCLSLRRSVTRKGEPRNRSG